MSSYLATVNELRKDALWRAGEPQSSSSEFWAKSLDYLNRIYQSLLLGGAVAVGRDLASSAGIYNHFVDLPITDWWWARKRLAFNTEAAIERSVTGTLAQGDTSMALTLAVTTDTRGYYIIFPTNEGAVLRSTGWGASQTIINFDAGWPEDSLTAPDVKIVKLDYTLPGDFLRFASPPYIHPSRGEGISVGTSEQRNESGPLGCIQGRPTSAFMTGPRTLTLNSWDTRPYRCEAEYILSPKPLEEGSAPPMPLHHRAVLSSGAAMLMMFDKGDDRAPRLASEYREMIGRMVQEHRRAIGGGSSTFAQFKPRDAGDIRQAWWRGTSAPSLFIL